MGRFWFGLVCCSFLFFQASPVWGQKNTTPPKAPIGAKTETDKSGSSEAALAIYADAANFLNGQAYDLAIEQWRRFLKEHANDPLAGKAAHYLGVSLLQREKPDYDAAAAAFQQALAFKGFDLREEALANLALCTYTHGRSFDNEPAKRDPLLKESIKAYSALAKEFPSSKEAARALFYSGEATYAMGDREGAIKYYQQLIKSAPADSPLRCDALYAQGVAEEELKRTAQAIETYAQLLKSCASSPLSVEVRIRRGDLYLGMDKADNALDEFRAAAAAGGDLADYAQYRYATSLLKLKRTDEAGKAYQELSTKFPQSRYAAAAQLSAAQSFYQAQKYDQATPIFERLLKSGDSAGAIEAAHWLARIALQQNKPQAALDVAQKTLQAHRDEAPYRDALQLDLAEAFGNLNKPTESLAAYAVVYSASKDPEMVSRALYDAAFIALQTRDSKTAIELSKKFQKQFPNDPVAPDMAYIAAEGLLQAGQFAESQAAYEKLLTEVKDHPSRNLWMLRAVSAAYQGGKFDVAAKNAANVLKQVSAPREKAEAGFLLGASHLFADRPKEAVEALSQAAAVKEPWPQVEECLLLLGQAQLRQGNKDAARTTWESLIAKSPKSRMADQARYREGQMLAGNSDFAGAAKLYQTILDNKADPGLVPYALYGAGWCALQLKNYDAAIKPLDQVIKEYKDHPMATDALLARGMTYRRQGKQEPAGVDLKAFLASRPKGNDLGHALYELALMDIEAKRGDAAVSQLKQLVEQVPEYPSLDKVIYELAWALKDSGKEEDATKQFELLVSKFPKAETAAEANYHIGQRRYADSKWDQAAQSFEQAVQTAGDAELKEKAMYKLGWSQFQAAKYETAEKTFAAQIKEFPKGILDLDARMMLAESRFKRGQYKEALASYQEARKISNERPVSKNADPQEQQVRELVLLHGGQSAAQLQQWKEALEWFGALREKFPSTRYLAQVFYETGYCHQNLDQTEEALKFYGQVAENYRTEVAARARFMMGEIHFGNRDPSKAIPEYQRVMLGFGAESAPNEIKNWQAKSAYEAGRCAELMLQDTTGDRRQRTVEIAKQFYDYVLEKHPNHDLVSKARERLDVLAKLK